ncbi:MAG: OadG family protein [Treponema sp.]|jgi:sodium pump decarboxylase gamma subunit|nr:OadG family protein [Treponema sp.]
MTIFEMLQQSTILTVLGMFVVFVFLWVMILFMNITGKIINDFRGIREAGNQKSLVLGTGEANTSEIKAAITAAVIEHEKG